MILNNGSRKKCKYLIPSLFQADRKLHRSLLYSSHMFVEDLLGAYWKMKNIQKYSMLLCMRPTDKPANHKVTAILPSSNIVHRGIIECWHLNSFVLRQAKNDYYGNGTKFKHLQNMLMKFSTYMYVNRWQYVYYAHPETPRTPNKNAVAMLTEVVKSWL